MIIDFQNDFTPPNGSLPVPEGHEVGGRLNELAASPRFELVVATRDWHPPDHGSFEQYGGPWPEHCVQGTEGAELHPDLDRTRVDVVIEKGQDPGTEGYSAFERPELGELLRKRRIDALTIAGLATNICVRGTALDALEEGFRVTIDTAGSRGVDAEPGDTERALRELQEAGATVA